jgi:hypothetical protein
MPLNSTSPDVEQKTTAVGAITNFEVSEKTNILNRYRSYTYNFTLAAVSADSANDAKSYQKSANQFLILQSGGKGSESGIRTASAENKQLIEKFNENSPGKFDMYIDDVDIKTYMAPSKEGGVTLPNKISFKVYEPYSINGFIEALQATARAAGHDNYAKASFLLKVEFLGYNDTDSLPLPERIENTSRYFLLAFTGLSVEITERGTTYACSAIPYNERGLGESGRLPFPTSMTGTKVKSVLENLMSNLTEGEKKNALNKSQQLYDQYRISFPGWVDGQGYVDDESSNKIADVDISTHRGGDLYRLLDPANEDASTNKQPVIQFKEGVNIYEIITSTIRDSQYVKDIIENIGKNIDSYGMVNYFIIKLEITNQSIVDTNKGRPFQIFNYVVTPYKVHYALLPGFQNNQKIDVKKLKTLVLREYNYLYTGLNVDVLKFKLDYNTLYFDALPRGLGKNNSSGSSDGAAPSENNAVASIATPIKTESTIPSTGQRASWKYVETHRGNNPNAGQPRPDDPYAAMAKNIHQGLVESVSKLTGEIEIIGDPFFLVTGGIGNYRPGPSDKQLGATVDNEADHYYGQVLISITFRNPIDIQTLKEGGLLKFSGGVSDASGVFMVTQVAHSFREGVFRQTMQLIRMPGQLPDPIPVTDAKQAIQGEENPATQVREATVPAGTLNLGAVAIAPATIQAGITKAASLPGNILNAVKSTANALVNVVQNAGQSVLQQLQVRK